MEFPDWGHLPGSIQGIAFRTRLAITSADDGDYIHNLFNKSGGPNNVEILSNPTLKSVKLKCLFSKCSNLITFSPKH